MKALVASARNAKRSLLTSSSMKACESSGRRWATYEPLAWDAVQLDSAQSRSASAASRRGLHLHMSCLPDYTSYHSIYLSERYEQRLAEHPTGGETPRRQRGVRAALERPRAAPCPAGRQASRAAVQARVRRKNRGAGQARAATRLRHSPCNPLRAGRRALYPPPPLSLLRIALASGRR